MDDLRVTGSVVLDADSCSDCLIGPARWPMGEKSQGTRWACARGAAAHQKPRHVRFRGPIVGLPFRGTSSPYRTTPLLD